MVFLVVAAAAWRGKSVTSISIRVGTDVGSSGITRVPRWSVCESAAQVGEGGIRDIGVDDDDGCIAQHLVQGFERIRVQCLDRRHVGYADEHVPAVIEY